jgi:hypothetical protein
MKNSDENFKQALIGVWRQSLVERKGEVELEGMTFPVHRTPRKNLLQVDFAFEGREIRGLEQNPNTKSRWAQMARSGKKVMQFLEGGRYIANVADGKLTQYGGSQSKSASKRQA